MKRAASLLALIAVVAMSWAGCSQQSTTVPVRSLERSGRAAFVCLGDPTSPSPGQPIDACFTPPNAFATNDYAAPHALALVTQTARGEVAVIDVTAQTVLDANAAIPGFNFLPVGAFPTDIVATPGGNASFVAVGDGLRPGIFAIPSSRLPVPVAGRPFDQAPTLASWPACSLDSVPTELAVVSDRSASQSGRCDASMPAATPTAGLDLTGEAAAYGRLKIVAVLPDLGQLVVIDAQELLMREPGTFDRCPIDRTLSLDGSASVGSDAGAVSTDGAASSGDAATDAGVDPATCSGRVTSSPVPSSMPHPVSMALADDGRLFVSDDRASVIHVVDVANPCAIAEGAPLLPFSAADPSRAVVTGAIAVSPLTSDMQRFVYAVDERVSNTVMVFDVSSGSTERRPLLRTDRMFNPFEPPDRILFSSPVQGLAFATNEAPLGNPGAMGQVPRGVKCKPGLSATATDDDSFPYRPVDFSQGAGPRRLRGTFGFAALTNGRVSIIDVDDFDQACRRPMTSDDRALGCQGAEMLQLDSASGEASCQTVERHRPRSAFYFANATNAGRHAPAMPTFPLLFDDLGTLLPTDPMRPESANQPKLLGPSLADKSPATRQILASVAGSDAVPDDSTNAVLSSDPKKATRNWVAFDLREPRAHVEQTWTVTFEGILTAFEVPREGRMVCAAPNNVTECEGGGATPSHFVLQDFSIGFCDAGAQGKAVAASLDLPSGDIVQVTEPLPDPTDPYWTTVSGVCSHATCEALYGTPEDPRPPRDFPIAASFQNRLELEPNAARGSAAPFDCCFPYPFTYVVRAGQHWLVRGSSTFAPHHIIPDPTQPNPSTAACIVSCDPLLKLRNSRAVALPITTPVPSFSVNDPNDPMNQDAPKGVFQNAQIRFVLWAPEKPTPIKRGSFFSFVEAGGFSPLEVPLVAGNTAVLAQSIQFVRGINQLAIPDAVSQGLMLFDLNVLSTNGVKPLY